MASLSQSYAAPAPQPVQQAEAVRLPTLVKGKVQPFKGYLTRQTTILKMWSKEWIEIEPGQ